MLMIVEREMGLGRKEGGALSALTYVRSVPRILRIGGLIGRLLGV